MSELIFSGAYIKTFTVTVFVDLLASLRDGSNCSIDVNNDNINKFLYTQQQKKTLSSHCKELQQLSWDRKKLHEYIAVTLSNTTCTRKL